MKKAACLIAFLLAICGSVVVYSAEANQVKKNTIRVAYPIQDGLTMVDEDGKYYGYTYDYLTEIAKYTGWDYEIVQMEGNSNEQAVQALQMLSNGEVDLMGGLYYDESLTEELSYPGYSYGTNYMGIYVPYSSSLTETNLYTSGIIRVGVYKRSLKRDEKLDQFAQMNSLAVEQVVVDSLQELNRLLESGEIDAILSSDLAVSEHKGMQPVARFSPKLLYLATANGNVEIVRQLDYAMSTVNQVTPNFTAELFNEYFLKFCEDLQLTDNEKAFIQNAGVQEVVLYGNRPPFCYMDEDTGELTGITVELFQRIAAATGMEFHLNPVSTYKEYLALTESGEMDIVGDLLLNHDDAVEYKSILTLPWHSLPVYMVFREDSDLGAGGRSAIPYYLKNAIAQPLKAVYYDTAEECLQAVRKGDADYAYAGEYDSQYLFNSGIYSKLKLFNQQEALTQKMSFGITDTDNFYLLSILNKSITFLPKDEVEALVYQYTYRQQEPSLSLWLEEQRGVLVIGAMVVVILILAGYITLRDRERRRIAFENQRYQAISNLSNEFFYEYDITKDELILPEKCAKYFSCDKRTTYFSKILEKIPAPRRTGIWAFGDHIVQSQEGTYEISCQMPDDSRQWFKLVCTPVVGRKQQAHAIGKIANIQDVKAEQIRLEQKAFTDGLTGIYNIATLKNMVERRLEQFEECAPCAFLVMDVDNFKQINDQYGHYNGDAVLVQVAGMISACFAPALAGRLGGDEFVIFVEKVREDDVARRCEKLCAMAREKTEELLGAPKTLSIGVTVSTEKKSFEILYKEADQALYKRKAGSKNGYTFYQV